MPYFCSDMLCKLYIKNYALIDALEVEFANTLNIITGETGSGKSVILSAIGLILGQRVDTTALKNTSEKCIVEGIYNIKGRKLKNTFDSLELDYDDECIVRREILPSGKSRAFVNDSPVNVATLKQLSQLLIDLNTQHQKFSIFESEYQLYLLDVLANQLDEVEKYRKQYGEFKASKNKLIKLNEALLQLKKEADYNSFQLQEIEEANLEAEQEQEQLEQTLKTLENATTINDTLQNAVTALQQSDDNLVQQLHNIATQFLKLKDISTSFETIAKRLESAGLELDDIIQEIEQQQTTVEFNPEKLKETEDRLSMIYKLQTKHNVPNIAELKLIALSLQQKVASTESIETEIEVLENNIIEQQKTLNKQAATISTKREKAAKQFEKDLAKELQQVGFNAATVVFNNTKSETTLTANGFDQFDLLFSANPGSAPKSIKLVASGGEISRVMLCLKNLMAGKVALPTIIFDEIDAGISGITAEKVADKIEDLANKHQVICITHLPQMASKGQHHFKVFKQTQNGNTFTSIEKLSVEARIQNISELLGSSQAGDTAIENAKALLGV